MTKYEPEAMPDIDETSAKAITYLSETLTAAKHVLKDDYYTWNLDETLRTARNFKKRIGAIYRNTSVAN